MVDLTELLKNAPDEDIIENVVTLDRDDFVPIAVRGRTGQTSVVSYRAGSKEFLISVAGKVSGPFEIGELEVLMANIADVISFDGTYLYIKEYEVDGKKK
tara:strand:- start:1928 stop:2227 length:300 start_codon:yes stop_codon:yes gene_type:complete